MEIVIRNKGGVEFKTELPIEKINEALKCLEDYYPEGIWSLYEYITKCNNNITDFEPSDIITILNDGFKINVSQENIPLVLRSLVLSNKKLDVDDTGFDIILQLEDMLEQSITIEEYEIASIIRNKIKELNEW
jgi:hypothetical protein